MKMEPTPDEIRSELEAITAEYIATAVPEPDGPADLNNGFCNAVAADLLDALDEPAGAVIHEAFSRNARHQWLEVDGRHYDAEVPAGVDDFEDLPIWSRTGAPDEPEPVTVA